MVVLPAKGKAGRASQTQTGVFATSSHRRAERRPGRSTLQTLHATHSASPSSPYSDKLKGPCENPHCQQMKTELEFLLLHWAPLCT